MDMTAPVITEDAVDSVTSQISQVSPGSFATLSSLAERKMEFILPFQFKSLTDIPKPTDDRVHLREVPAQKVAVLRFSGWYSDKLGEYYRKELFKKLVEGNVINRDTTEESLKWKVAQYHPPFTLPFLRRNEVWIKVDEFLEGMRRN